MRASDHNLFYINKHTNLIYQRFYMSKRLKPIIEHIMASSIETDLFEKIDDTVFSHRIIQKAIRHLKECKHADVLGSLWNSFIAYRYLYEPSFADEFVQLACLICLLQHASHGPRAVLSCEHSLCLLDDLADSNDTTAMLPLKQHIPEDHKDAVTIDHIAERYFVLKRLHKAIHFLKNDHAQAWAPEKKIGEVSIDYTLDIRESIPNFKHDRIRKCLDAVCVQKTLDPFFSVYAECEKYRYITDNTFLREMLMSIFLIYKNMFMQSLSKKSEHTILYEVQKLLEIYEKFDRYSLEEILDAIDSLTHSLMDIHHRQAIYHKKDLGMQISIVCGFLGALFFYHIQ